MNGLLRTRAPAALVAAVLAAPGAAAAADRPDDPSAQASPVVVRVDDRGFDWADAAIGAAAGFGVALLMGGGAVALGLAHDRQPHRGRDGSRGRSPQRRRT